MSEYTLGSSSSEEEESDEEEPGGCWVLGAGLGGLNAGVEVVSMIRARACLEPCGRLDCSKPALPPAPPPAGTPRLAPKLTEQLPDLNASAAGWAQQLALAAAPGADAGGSAGLSRGASPVPALPAVPAEALPLARLRRDGRLFTELQESVPAVARPERPVKLPLQLGAVVLPLATLDEAKLKRLQVGQGQRGLGDRAATSACTLHHPRAAAVSPHRPHPHVPCSTRRASSPGLSSSGAASPSCCTTTWVPPPCSASGPGSAAVSLNWGLGAGGLGWGALVGRRAGVRRHGVPWPA